MNIAFALYKYFPYGGLQRNMLSIAAACLNKGFTITIYAGSWDGAKPKNINIKLFNGKQFTNYNRNIKFCQWLQQSVQHEPVDLLIGMNKMPGIDLYYAADPCFAVKAYEDRNFLYRITPRSRNALAFEKAVFGKDSATHTLLVSANEKFAFQQYYATTEDRFHVLPPGISKDRIAPTNAAQLKTEFRNKAGIAENEILLLALGSGFKTKGVDRTLKALAQLPKLWRNKVRLFVVGQDNPKIFIKMARSLNIDSQVEFFPGRDDVPALLLGADLLVHPAYRENTGNVLLEAIIAGLPVITTDVCGYAHYVTDANMGSVLTSPFSQQSYNHELLKLLDNIDQDWQTRGRKFAETADIYRRPEFVANIIEQLILEKAHDN